MTKRNKNIKSFLDYIDDFLRYKNGTIKAYNEPPTKNKKDLENILNGWVDNIIRNAERNNFQEKDKLKEYLDKQVIQVLKDL